MKRADFSPRFLAQATFALTTLVADLYFHCCYCLRIGDFQASSLPAHLTSPINPGTSLSAKRSHFYPQPYALLQRKLPNAKLQRKKKEDFVGPFQYRYAATYERLNPSKMP
jgi:hypothetical protein